MNYVVLRGLANGNVFWTTTDEGDDPTKLADGTTAYEIIAYADTPEEAKGIWAMNSVHGLLGVF